MDTHLSHAEAFYSVELDMEDDTFPSSKNADIVRMCYDPLRSVAQRIQTVVGDLATQEKRLLAILSWRYPCTPTIFITVCLLTAVHLAPDKRSDCK